MAEDKKNAEDESPGKKQAEEQKEKKESASSGGASGHLKITKMSLKQVENAIVETRKKMGGLHSRFGRALQERQAFLTRDQ